MDDTKKKRAGNISTPSERLDELIDLIYSELLFECLVERIFAFDRARYQSTQDCQSCGLKCAPLCRDTSKDIFGRELNSMAIDKCDCPTCGIVQSTNRFAPHLEKCLGIGGRRTNQRR